MNTFYFYTELERPFHCRRVLAMLNGKLPLTNPSHFNDPFDSKLRVKNEVTEKSAKEDLGYNTSCSPLQQKLLCLKGLIPAAEEKREKALWNRWTIFCVSEVNDSLLMWSHYGNSHSGICLQLEYDKSLVRDGDIFEKVRCTTHYPEISGELIERGDKTALETLLLTKSVDWLYEKEWRLVCQNAPNEEDFDGLIKSPFRVVGIYFGSKFDPRGSIESKIGEQIEEELSSLPEETADDIEVKILRKEEQMEGVRRKIKEGAFEHLIAKYKLGGIEDVERLLFREQLIMAVQGQSFPKYKFSLVPGEFNIESTGEYDLLCGAVRLRLSEQGTQ